MSSGIQDIYQENLSGNFNTKAIVFPPTRQIELGDYGEFKKGNFEIKGNIFKHFSLNPAIYLNDSLDNSPVFNNLIASKNATSSGGQAAANGQGKFDISISFKFNSEKGFLLQLAAWRSDSLYTDAKLARLVRSLWDSGEWKRRYRMVVERNVARSLKFVYSLSSQSQITLAGEASTELAEVASLNLQIDWSQSRDMQAEFWNDATKDVPFALSLARYGPASGDIKPKVKDEEEFMFTPDNSDSEEAIELEEAGLNGN